MRPAAASTVEMWPDPRLDAGFVRDTRLDGDTRIVSFANGAVAREVLVDSDDARRRLVYAVQSERLTQHSASVQVFADGDGSRLVWICDFLPNAQYFEQVRLSKFMRMAVLDRLWAPA